MTDKQDAQAAVDRLVLEQGEYLPIELLLAEGRLHYADYEEWRAGQVESLEAVLLGNPAKIRDRLAACADYAGRIGLSSRQVNLSGWGGARGRQLRCAEDRRFDDMYTTAYAPARTDPQMDLFFDAGAQGLVNDVVNALLARDAAAAEHRLERLIDRDPGHRQLGALERLTLAVSGAGPTGQDAPMAVLDMREQIVPLAREILGPRARDYLAPLWSRLALALADVPFDPAAPHVHASYALEQAWDFAAAAASIEAEPQWWLYPDAMLRRAGVLSRLGKPERAIPAWFEACWRFPRAAAAMLDTRRDLDAVFLSKWRDFRDLDPELAVEKFPGWCRIVDPSLRAYSPERADAFPALDEAFTLLGELLNGGDPRAAVVHGAVLKARARLRDLDADLFGHYLAAVGR